MAVRHLYLARHGEPNDHGVLTDDGRRQATLLGQRLRPVEFASIHHGPLPRATETASAVAAQLPSAPLPVEIDAAGDYIPPLPGPGDLDPDHADRISSWLADVTAAEAEVGVDLALQASERFTGPASGAVARDDLVVTHAFTIGWLVSQALGAPAWRWIGWNFGHATLTVIRYADDLPATVVVLNEMSHLPIELRWTGFPDRPPF